MGIIMKTTRPYTMGARAEQVERTREQVLAAAIALSGELPLASCSLPLVAERAGVSVQTILRQFGSRDELFDAAVERGLATIVDERVADPDDVEASIASLIAHYERLGDAVLLLLGQERWEPRARRITDGGRRMHRAWVEQVFARALEGRAPADREATVDLLVAATDVGTWKLWRRDRDLGRAATTGRMLRLAASVVADRTRRRERRTRAEAMTMSTITVITLDAGGNVPPALAIAGRLRERGHEVHVLGREPQRERFALLGLEFAALDELGFWEDGRRRSTRSALAAFARLASGRALTAEVRARLDAIRPDAVLADCMMPAAVRAATEAGVPTAVLFHSLLEYWTTQYLRGPVGVVARLQGAPIREIWNGADERIVVSDPVLDRGARDGARRLRDAIWVGATDAGVPAEPDPGEPPLVVVSLSTTRFPGQTDVYQRVATALGTLPVRGLITAGGLPLRRDLDLPPNVELRTERVDHSEVMRRASLVVGHGGHSTTCTALAHGVPVLVLPMHPLTDQPAVGAAIARTGVGRRLRRSSSPSRVASEVSALLADRSTHERAAAMGVRLRATDAAGDAVRVLEALAARRPQPGAAGRASGIMGGPPDASA